MAVTPEPSIVLVTAHPSGTTSITLRTSTNENVAWTIDGQAITHFSSSSIISAGLSPGPHLVSIQKGGIVVDEIQLDVAYGVQITSYDSVYDPVLLGDYIELEVNDWRGSLDSVSATLSVNGQLLDYEELWRKGDRPRITSSDENPRDRRLIFVRAEHSATNHFVLSGRAGTEESSQGVNVTVSKYWGMAARNNFVDVCVRVDIVDTATYTRAAASHAKISARTDGFVYFEGLLPPGNYNFEARYWGQCSDIGHSSPIGKDDLRGIQVPSELDVQVIVTSSGTIDIYQDSQGA